MGGKCDLYDVDDFVMLVCELCEEFGVMLVLGFVCYLWCVSVLVVNEFGYMVEGEIYVVEVVGDICV